MQAAVWPGPPESQNMTLSRCFVFSTLRLRIERTIYENLWDAYLKMTPFFATFIASQLKEPLQTASGIISLYSHPS